MTMKLTSISARSEYDHEIHKIHDDQSMNDNNTARSI